ncbi:MAG: hypothetical protein C4318_08035 [Acidimicrobiia bacterium]
MGTNRLFLIVALTSEVALLMALRPVRVLLVRVVDFAFARDGFSVARITIVGGLFGLVALAVSGKLDEWEDPYSAVGGKWGLVLLGLPFYFASKLGWWSFRRAQMSRLCRKEVMRRGSFSAGAGGGISEPLRSYLDSLEGSNYDLYQDCTLFLGYDRYRRG